MLFWIPDPISGCCVSVQNYHGVLSSALEKTCLRMINRIMVATICLVFRTRLPRSCKLVASDTHDHDYVDYGHGVADHEHDSNAEDDADGVVDGDVVADAAGPPC